MKMNELQVVKFILNLKHLYRILKILISLTFTFILIYSQIFIYKTLI